MPTSDEVIAELGGIIETLIARIEALEREKAEAREVARLAVTTWHWHQEAGHPPSMGCDEPRIQALYREHPWLKDDPLAP